MRQFLTFLALTATLVAQDKISYDDHVLRIFEQSCLNCHNPDKTKGGLDLSNFAGAIKGGSSGKIVEPGDTSSTLINSVKHTADPKMPPEGEKLSEGDIDVLVKWIEGGLLENKSSTARKPAKPQFQTALRSDPAAKPDGPPPIPEHLLLEPPVVTEKPSAVHSIAASPWAPLLAATSQHQVLLYDTASLELTGILPFPEGDPISLAFTPDARYLIVGGGIPGKNGFTITFDVTNGSRVVTAAKEFDSILAADIRPSFDIVATGGPSKLLKLWNTQTGEMTHSIKKHTDWITSIDISPDGILLASGDRNGGVWVWEAETANEFHTLRAHQAAITTLSFRSDSNLLASASEDGSVRFWEMNNGGEVKKLDAHTGGVSAFAFGKDGSFVTAGRDNKARLWKADFNQLREIPLPALATSAAIASDGKRAFVADALGNIHTFSAEESGTPDLITFPTNPPTIATRLQQIATRITEIQAKLDHLRPVAGTPPAEIEAAQPTADDPAALEAEITRLRVIEKSWSAAAINTHALKAASETKDLSMKTDAAIDTLKETLIALNAPNNALAAKRQQRENFAVALEKSSLKGESLDEARATLRALDASLANHSDTLREKEIAIATLRAELDSISQSLGDARSQFTRLRSSYLQALK